MTFQTKFHKQVPFLTPVIRVPCTNLLSFLYWVSLR